MKKLILILSILVFFNSCTDFLEPEPVTLLTNELAFNEPSDVPIAEIGLYASFRSIAAPTVIAGDFTADLLTHNGTFTQYQEIGNKEITPSNSTAASLWGSIYSTVYVANFIIENLPNISGLSSETRDNLTATARFLRGYAYFVGVNSFGDIPLVTTTDIATNKNIPRTNKAEILVFILEDFEFALNQLPDESINAGYVNTYTVRAALAKYYLYTEQWVFAEQFATEVLNSGVYVLESDYSEIVNSDFTDEAIFEVGYSAADDPGTSGLGLNNLFIGRREIIPSNQAVTALASNASGDRFSSIQFSIADLGGSDNGWSVAKYGTADADNNNIIIMRLGEMHLIRAEALAQQGVISGPNSATSDINILRSRANAPTISVASQAQMISIIEQERLYELAYEGHRWYDLVRTDRATTVMSAYSSNWSGTFELWPVPQREIQNNPALAGAQNPGY